MVKVIKLILGAATLIAIGFALWLWNPLPSNPNTQALSLGAKRYSAEVVRDQWGVPHIVGQRNVDTSFGLAYAHAEDDFETIQETIAATRGVLAQYRGRSAATTDYLVQLFDVWGAVERRYDEIPGDVIAIAEAYAAGANLYASQHPDEIWPGLAPFTAQDVIAGFVFKTPFFYGLDKPLMDLFDEQNKLEIALAPVGDDLAWSLTERGRTERGSNAIAVAAKRSPDKTARLLINSHQPMTGPVAWYEAHLHAQQGWRIQGGVFPGTPVILHGFNESLGWASTVNHIDLWDEYLLTRNPDNPNQYLLDGEWQDFERREVTLSIKLLGPFRFPAKRTILHSKHGPVIEVGDRTYALRYAGMGEVGQLEQYVRLNQATDYQSFMQAMELVQLPSINFVYADKDSNIAFIHNAQYPNRTAEAWDWSKGLPGDKSELIWQGYRPFAQVPKLINPQSGLIFNANNTPFTATDGADNLRPEQFPDSMGLAVNQTNRSWRLLELNDGVSPIGEAELLEQKFDIEYSKQSDAYANLQKIIALDWADSPQLAKAQNIIQRWDLRADIENPNAAMPITILRELFNNKDQDDTSPAALRSAAERAVAYLQSNYGRLNPKWGEVNRLLRGEFNQAVNGGPDLMRAIYSQGHGPNEKAYATVGDTWMAVVAWNQQGELSAKVLHQFGSATLDESSPHYADQAELFVKQQWREASFDLAKIRAHAADTYVVGGAENKRDH